MATIADYSGISETTEFVGSPGTDDTNYADQEAHASAIATMGAKWIRIGLKWPQVQSGGPTVFHWYRYDHMFDYCRRLGLKVYVQIAECPPWAQNYTQAGRNNIWSPPNATNVTINGRVLSGEDIFAEFCGLVCQRYLPATFTGQNGTTGMVGGITVYAVWNEPNNNQFWDPPKLQNGTVTGGSGPPADASGYAPMLLACGKRMHTMAPGCQVACGEIAAGSAVVSGVHFLENIYVWLEANGDAPKACFDVVGFHPYWWGSLVQNSTTYNKKFFEGLFITDSTLSGSAAWYKGVYSIMCEHGDGTGTDGVAPHRGKKVYGGEFGTPVGATANGKTFGTWAFPPTIASYDSWVGVCQKFAGPLFYFQGRDQCTTATSVECNFGILTAGLTDKTYSGATLRNLFKAKMATAVSGGGTNQPPVAAYGFTPTAPLVNDVVTFDAGASSDPDGTIASYSWAFGGGAALGTGKTLTHRFPSANTYTIVLTVTDNAGATSSVSHTITVYTTPPANQPPQPQLSSSPAAPDTTTAVTFDASGSTDPDGTVVSYAFDFGDGATRAASGVATATHTYAGAGTYTCTVTVVDDGGASASTTASVTVTNPPPLPPSTAVGQVVKTFVKPVLAAGATLDIRGLPVQPRAGMIWTGGNPQDGVAAPNLNQGIGLFAVRAGGAITQYGAASASADNVTPSNTSRRMVAAALTVCDAGEVLLDEARVTAIYPDGFQLTFDTVSTQTYQVHVWVIGGTDLADAVVLNWQAPAVGTVPVTQALPVPTGFGTPSIGFHLTPGQNSAALPFLTTNGAFGFGCGNALGQWAACTISQDNQTAAVARSEARTDACILGLAAGTGGELFRAHHGAFGADAASVIYDVIPNTASQVASLLIRAASTTIFRPFNFAKTTTLPASGFVTQTVTVPGVGASEAVRGLMLVAIASATTSAAVANGGVTIGVAEYSTTASSCFIDQSGANPTAVESRDISDRIYAEVDANGVSQVSASVLTWPALGSGGVVLTFDSNSAVANRMLGLAIGDSSSQDPAFARTGGLQLAGARSIDGIYDRTGTRAGGLTLSGARTIALSVPVVPSTYADVSASAMAATGVEVADTLAAEVSVSVSAAARTAADPRTTPPTGADS